MSRPDYAVFCLYLAFLEGRDFFDDENFLTDEGIYVGLVLAQLELFYSKRSCGYYQRDGEHKKEEKLPFEGQPCLADKNHYEGSDCSPDGS